MIGVLVRGSLVRSLLGLAVTAVVVGCGGGSTYSVDTGDLAQRFLPTERTVAYHPDSLGSLSITQEQGTYNFELESDYEDLHRRWSSTYQSLGVGRSRSGLSYATFWSLELSLASLQPEVGITALSQEQAEKALRERRQQYNSTIQVDVYWFEAEGESLLTSPGTRVQLRVGGERYEPVEKTNGPLRDAILPTRGRSALYRRNTFYFPRVVEGADILAGAQSAELRVQRAGAGSAVQFAWSWETGAQARVHPTTPHPLPSFRTGDVPGHEPDRPAAARRSVPTFNH